MGFRFKIWSVGRPFVDGILKETKPSILQCYFQFSLAATQEVADVLADQLGPWDLVPVLCGPLCDIFVFDVCSIDQLQ
jgi:hypothetical protein